MCCFSSILVWENVRKLWQIHNYVNTLVVENVVENHFGLCGDIKYKVFYWNWICYKNKNYNSLLHIVPFCEGPNQKSEGFAKEKKKREGFAKEKKLATFAMPSASQLVAQQSSQIYNEPLIIADLLRNSRQTKLCDPLNTCPS